MGWLMQVSGGSKWDGVGHGGMGWVIGVRCLSIGIDEDEIMCYKIIWGPPFGRHAAIQLFHLAHTGIYKHCINISN